MAIGMPIDMPRRQISLTQLRRNKRKKADKTAGRKRPRVRDVDVVAAGDTDDAALDVLHTEVTGNLPQDVEPDFDAEPQTLPDAPYAASQSAATEADTEDDRCAECGLPEPPRTVSSRRVIHWGDCNSCHYWHHACCVRSHRKSSGRFVCSRC